MILKKIQTSLKNLRHRNLNFTQYCQRQNKIQYGFSQNKLKIYEKYQKLQEIEEQDLGIQALIYERITLDYIKDILEAVQFLKKQDQDLVQIAIKVFLENIFPEEKRERIIQLTIQEWEKAEEKQEFLSAGKEEQQLLQCREVQKCLEYILEFLDSGQKGFLPGDLSVEAIQRMEALLVISLEDITLQTNSHNYQAEKDAVLSALFIKLQNLLFQPKLFKLPIQGIKCGSQQNPRNLFERQLVLEEQSNTLALDSYLNTFDNLQNLEMTQKLQFSTEFIKAWWPKIFLAIQEEQKKCLEANLDKERRVYAKYLLNVSAEQVAIICLSEFMKKVLKYMYYYQLEGEREDQDISQYVLEGDHQAGSVYIVNAELLAEIGKEINKQYVHEFENTQLESLKKDQLKSLQSQKNKLTQQMSQQEIENKEYLEQVSQIEQQMHNIKTAKPRYYQRQGQSPEMNTIIEQNELFIPKKVQLVLGGLCTYLMHQLLDLNGNKVFQFGYANSKGHSQKHVGVVVVSNELVQSIDRQVHLGDDLFSHLRRSLPMIYKPARWVDYEIGGYYLKPTNVMRIQENSQEICLKHADLSQIFDVLDVLGETAWTINNPVLELMEALWAEGGGHADLPLRALASTSKVFDYHLRETQDPKVKRAFIKQMQSQRDNHSMVCDFSLKLSVARAFKDVEAFYFPHNLDFRGRVYPIAPHLNHMGHDICRGLLLFAKAEPIGPSGLYWLKIHLANQMGQDKLSFQERVQYVDTHLDSILDMARHPLIHREWMSLENAWQAIAAMIEIDNALKSNNPSSYQSRMHVHVDGSCNGLQHYAALGRDLAGAHQVNLANSTKPGDVYTYVSKMVEQKLLKDYDDPNSDYHQLALVLKGNIIRKTVKQTVMTSVYGVTFIGAKQQIKKQLKDKAFCLSQPDVDMFLQKASHYLALLTLDAIKDLFSSAHEIKHWLKECSALIGKNNHNVQWVTPLGLPCIQPYRTKTQHEKVKTLVQDIVVYRSDMLGINKQKQQTAFPPNFIHSLDSTHMMYTALNCKKLGITFAAVHDSYWTHVSKIDQLNDILRDQFIHLHSQPLLENLRDSFLIRYPDVKFPPIPQRGEFDLNEIKESKYFFA